MTIKRQTIQNFQYALEQLESAKALTDTDMKKLKKLYDKVVEYHDTHCNVCGSANVERDTSDYLPTQNNWLHCKDCNNITLKIGKE